MSRIRQLWLFCQILRTEWRRVITWKYVRRDPLTGRRRSWRDACRAVLQNPPAFDRHWDELFVWGIRP